MSLTLQQFIEGCMQFPIICGWNSGETCIMTDDFDGEVEMTVEIHKAAIEKFDDLSDAFDWIREEAKKLFGENLTSIVINENGEEKADWSPYFINLRIKYKEPENNEG